MKWVIGLTGEPGGGKGSFVSVLRNLANNRVQIEVVRSSDILKDTLDLWGIPFNRPNCAWLFETMKTKFGPRVLADAIDRRLEQSSALLTIFDGVRLDEDVETIRRFPKHKIVYVTAEEELRHQRVLARREKADEGNLTLEEFRRQAQAPNEVHIPRIGSMPDVLKIDNNGDFNLLQRQVESFYQNL